MRIIIDCDAGVDDAIALIIACRSDHELIAVTCCHGNCGVHYVCRNVRYILNLTGRKNTKVYCGADRPFITADGSQSDYAAGGHAATHALQVHGSGGLGEFDPGNVAAPLLEEENAVLALIRLCQEAPTRLIALGPLTNIALASRLDPAFYSRLESLHIMGGSRYSGNVTPSAEFNFYADPEAADMVMREATCPVWLTPIEPCIVQGQTVYSWKWFDETIGGNHTATSKFLAEVYKSFRLVYPQFMTFDPFTVAVALNEAVCEEKQQVKCEVERGGRRTRGHLLITETPLSNVNMITKISAELFTDIVVKACCS